MSKETPLNPLPSWQLSVGLSIPLLARRSTYLMTRLLDVFDLIFEGFLLQLQQLNLSAAQFDLKFPPSVTHQLITPFDMPRPGNTSNNPFCKCANMAFLTFSLFHRVSELVDSLNLSAHSLI